MNPEQKSHSDFEKPSASSTLSHKHSHSNTGSVALALRGLSKQYPTQTSAENPALHALDLELRAGELLTVVGPSGCGKSTLLKLLAGLEEPTAGTMVLEGKTLNGLPPKQRDVSLMFQNYALYPHLSMRENMGFGLIVRGMKKAKAYAEVQIVAERLGLADLLDRMPSEVSGGERQRAALARALLRHPKLFLFDEPLSSLDAALRAQLRVEIGKLHRELSAAMLFVTHDQSEAMTLGDRVAVLHQGRLQQVAEPDTLYDKPANRFVAGFIGNPGMSFLECECSREGETWTLRHPDMTSPLALPPETAAAHPGLRPGPVTLGLRPEHIHVDSESIPHPEAGSQPDSISAAPCGLGGGLVLAERLGGSTLLYLQGEKARFIARLGTAPGLRGPIPSLGESLILHPDWKAARLFNAQTGQALTTSSERA